uniref:Uncharacterized protein n=1 Tax=Oryza brachyantha TaxID=4533 RepID=J3LIH8_ORYBR
MAMDQEKTLQGGFLIKSSASLLLLLVLLALLLEEEDDDDEGVESELNQTPIDLKSDLSEAALPPPPPSTESGRDHAGLHAHRSLSGSGVGVRRPDDDEEMLRRRSRPSMFAPASCSHARMEI